MTTRAFSSSPVAMSSAVRRKKRDVACAATAAAAAAVAPSPSHLAIEGAKKQKPPAASAAPEAHGGHVGDGVYEEMGVGRAARVKRFSLGVDSGGSSSSDAVHVHDNFLLPVAGTVSACLHSVPLSNGAHCRLSA
jgi:hypothetical protein